MNNLTDLTIIQQYIENWDTLRHNSEAIKTYLNDADSFTFTNVFPDAEELHIYPGIDIDTQKMYMFILDADKDANRDYSNILSVEVNADNLETEDLGEINAKPEVPSSIDEEIPAREAISRIVKWRLDRNSWIDTQAATEVGIFSAFAVPCSYMVLNEVYVSMFALKKGRGSNYLADLVTINNSFYNVCRPVPPFGGKDKKTKYGLLP